MLRPVTRTSRQTVTVINGHTVVAPIQAGPSIPSPTASSPADSTSPSTAEVGSITTRRNRPDVGSNTEEQDASDSKTSPSETNILDSPPTGVILSASSPTPEEVSNTATRIRDRPTKTPTPTKTKTPQSVKASEEKEDPKSDKGQSASTWIAIAGGVIGGLLLLMAVSAYYRRWRRKRKEKASGAADDESFVATKQVDFPVSSASSPIRAAPVLRSRPQPQSRSHSGRASLLPEPGSEPMPEDEAPSRRNAYTGGVPVMAPGLRYADRNEPTVIETSGDSRAFTRPVSEVIMHGQSDQVADQYYDFGGTNASQNVRHNSYASSGYEALDDPRRTMLDYRYQ